MIQEHQHVCRANGLARSKNYDQVNNTITLWLNKLQVFAKLDKPRINSSWQSSYSQVKLTSLNLSPPFYKLHCSQPPLYHFWWRQFVTCTPTYWRIVSWRIVIQISCWVSIIGWAIADCNSVQWMRHYNWLILNNSL